MSSRYDDFELAVLVDRIYDCTSKKWSGESVKDVIRELGNVLEVLGESTAAGECRKGAGLIEEAEDYKSDLEKTEKELEDLKELVDIVLDDAGCENLDQLKDNQDLQIITASSSLDREKLKFILNKLEGLNLDKVIEKLKIKALRL
jgi:ribosomal protein L12E/L44/L45/RPP1/RPP2